jgi:NAD(P)-dependent dehydrogenase (short-subunit alcohol dehydrogenase family)
VEVDLKGRRAGIVGVHHSIAKTVAHALAANGADVVLCDAGAASRTFDMLILSHDLTPPATLVPSLLIETAQRAARQMSLRGAGRIVHLISALALVPMRRHPEFSAAAAMSVAAVRALAMTSAPNILVNAVAVGAIGGPDDLASGDAAMLSHVSINRPGTEADVANAALFLLDPANTYTTGQVLAVDGGWTIGYARNF